MPPDRENATTQQAICARFGSPFFPSPDDLRVGISGDLLTSSWQYPLNGLRVCPDPSTTGWFIWSGIGEPSQDDDYFKPLHVIHLPDHCAEILPYLGLEPGWRFLLAPDHEDVWFDETLLKRK